MRPDPEDDEDESHVWEEGDDNNAVVKGGTQTGQDKSVKNDAPEAGNNAGDRKASDPDVTLSTWSLPEVVGGGNRRPREASLSMWELPKVVGGNDGDSLLKGNSPKVVTPKADDPKASEPGEDDDVFLTDEEGDTAESTEGDDYEDQSGGY